MSLKAKIAAYAGVAAVALLSPEYLFLEYMDLQFSIMGTDLSEALAWLFGAVIGIGGSALIRKLGSTSGSSAGGSIISTFFKSGGLS